jgi:Ras family protein
VTGKSSLTVQFVEQHFVERYTPTIENEFEKTVKYKGKDYLVQILDTAGQDEFSVVDQRYINAMDGYVLIYSVTLRSSFEMIRVVRDKILNTLGMDSVPVVIVGNKSDLHMQRQVTKEEGIALAKELDAAFIETSAKYDENVTKAFESLLAEIEKQSAPDPKQRQSSCIIA